MRGLRNILWLLPLTAVLFWPLWGGSVSDFLSPGRGGETEASLVGPGRPQKEEQQFTMLKVLFTQLEKGELSWEIVTDKLFTGNDANVLEMERVNAQLYEGGSRKFHIVSDHGEYNTRSKVIHLKDNVKVTSKEGSVIRSPFLTYDDVKQKIRTKSRVHIVAQDMDIRGTGLDYDMRTGAYDIGGRVKVNVKE
jgi:LPS export ABC transporter protein LptC